jgi:ribosomal protein S27E
MDSSCAQASGKDIIIVTRDSDYGCSYDGKFHLNEWLRLEFKERISQKRRIVLTDRLAEAFKLVAVPVSAAAEEEEKRLVAERSATQSVRCGQCGRALEESPSLAPHLRVPCPNCGSTTRRFEVAFHEGVSLGSSGT